MCVCRLGGGVTLPMTSIPESQAAAIRIEYRFTPVPEVFLERLAPHLTRFWCVLYKNAKAKGYAWFERKTVAKWLGVSVRTISRWIGELKDKGLLSVRRTGRNSRYFLTNPVEKLRKGVSEVPKMAHRIEEDSDLKPTVISPVGSNSNPPVQNQEKVAAPAASLPRTIPTEQFLDLWRQEKQRGGLAHARDAVKNILDRLNLPPKLRDS